jgi:tetratricopeptide (TPR) repeat protein
MLKHVSRFLGGAMLLTSPLTAQRIDLPVSLGELEQRARADSNDAIAHYNLALGYWNAKRWDDVESALRTSLMLEPRLAVSRLALARLPYIRRPRLTEELFESTTIPRDLRDMVQAADREWRHAFMIDPTVDLRIIAATYSAGVDQWLVQDVMGEVWSNYFQASIDCYEGRYAQCEQRFTRVIDDFGDAGPGVRTPDGVYFLRGLAAARTDNFDRAIRDFRMLIGREEERKEALEEKDLVRIPLQINEFRYFVAPFTHAAGRSTEAIGLYREAVENDLGLYMAHVRLASIFEAQRDYPRAIEERRRAINANPDDATLHLDLGISMGKSGNFAEAEKSIRVTTERIPRHVESWFWLGLALEQQGKREEARAAYQKVVELAPSRLKARADAARAKVAALQ